MRLVFYVLIAARYRCLMGVISEETQFMYFRS